MRILISCEDCGQRVFHEIDVKEEIPKHLTKDSIGHDCPSKTWHSVERLADLIAATVDVYYFIDEPRSRDDVKVLRNLVVLGQHPQRRSWMFRNRMLWCKTCFLPAGQKCLDKKHDIVTDHVHHFYPSEIVGIDIQ